MRRRAVILGLAAGAGAAVLPSIAARPVPSDEAIAWLVTVQGMTYGQRSQYVEALRRQPVYRDSNQFAELVDMLDDMNERGSFA